MTYRTLDLNIAVGADYTFGFDAGFDVSGITLVCDVVEPKSREVVFSFAVDSVVGQRINMTATDTQTALLTAGTVYLSDVWTIDGAGKKTRWYGIKFTAIERFSDV